jgi:triosephosphate isomerase
LGHSERRRSLEQGGSGETDQIVNTKLKSALKHGITPIVCIGEPKREVDGSHLRFIRNQIKNSLSGLPSSQLALVVIAYEPIWAIGGRANTAITGHELHQVSLYIRKVLAELWRPAIADEVRILYGGSVKPQNAFDLAKNGNMDGFLVGGASLEADSFIGIANEMKRAAKNG